MMADGRGHLHGRPPESAMSFSRVKAVDALHLYVGEAIPFSNGVNFDDIGVVQPWR